MAMIIILSNHYYLHSILAQNASLLSASWMKIVNKTKAIPESAFGVAVRKRNSVCSMLLSNGRERSKHCCSTLVPLANVNSVCDS